MPLVESILLKLNYSEIKSRFGLGHVLNGKSSGTVYHLIFERHFITFLCQLIGLDA